VRRTGREERREARPTARDERREARRGDGSLYRRNHKAKVVGAIHQQRMAHRAHNSVGCYFLLGSLATFAVIRRASLHSPTISSGSLPCHSHFIGCRLHRAIIDHPPRSQIKQAIKSRFILLWER
jgi:hypothetical protein